MSHIKGRTTMVGLERESRGEGKDEARVFNEPQVYFLFSFSFSSNYYLFLQDYINETYDFSSTKTSKSSINNHTNSVNHYVDTLKRSNFNYHRSRFLILFAYKHSLNLVSYVTGTQCCGHKYMTKGSLLVYDNVVEIIG